MKNPNNVMIRTSKATDEELDQFVAWCEVCGAKGIYGDIHHDFPNDIIMCKEHIGGPTAVELIKMFNKINDDCMRAQEDSIPFSDVDYYAEQIENIFGVTEIRAYELAQGLTMREFKTSGFHHVTAAGMMEFWQLLEEKGSIDLLWDMKPTTKTNALMQSEDFDLDAHIKTNYVGMDYDEILTELHDEMIDAITALEFAFTTNQTAMHFNGRSIENLDCIPSTNVWNPNVYLPLTPGHVFTSYDEFSVYCMDATTDSIIDVVVATGDPTDEDGDGHIDQKFEWKVTGAADCNTLGEIADVLISWGYNSTYTLK